MASDFYLKVALFGSVSERNTLGFNLDLVNHNAQFDYHYYDKGLYVGRHLLSTIYLKLIMSFRPDVILSHELGINTLVAIALKHIFGYRLYTTIDDSPDMANSVRGLREWLRKFIMTHIDGAITVNPQVTELLNEKYGSGNFQSIFFPIIQDDKILSNKINNAYRKAERYIEDYELKNKKIVLFVGRLEKMKNTVWLSECFAELNVEDAVLVIVGKGSEHEKLNNMIMSKGACNRIITTGSLSGDDLYAWYYLAHIFVLPSSFECFGAVVNEALVAGCRTVVSDKVGACSLISESNGCVFKSGDTADIKRCLTKELQNVEANKKHQSLMQNDFDYYYSKLIKHITK